MRAIFHVRHLALAVALAFDGTEKSFAATAPKPVSDSAPVLMSKTGGKSDTWADLKELQQAAPKGNPKAQAQLGEMLIRGDGITRNDARGVEWLEKAARSGHSGAAFRIGMLLMNGDCGVAKNQPRALDYFRAAAAGGEKEAFFNLGAAYASARGVKRDYAEALGWLIVARQHGADASVENSLRAQIKSQTAWITKGEQRATEITKEFTGKKVIDLLPPAAALEAVEDPAPIKPSLRPMDDLKPKLTPPPIR
jgi:TPR repeat protein